MNTLLKRFSYGRLAKSVSARVRLWTPPGVLVPTVDHGVNSSQAQSAKWTCLCFPLQVMFVENGAQQWVKTYIDQCRTGKLAELHFYCEGGHLKVTMSADLGPVLHKNVNLSGCRGGESGSPSRVRRRERRAAERAAAEHAAAVKVADEKAAAEEVAAVGNAAEKAAAEKCAAEKAAAEKCATEKAAAENCAAKNAAAEKGAAENDAAEKDSRAISPWPIGPRTLGPRYPRS